MVPWALLRVTALSLAALPQAKEGSATSPRAESAWRGRGGISQRCLLGGDRKQPWGAELSRGFAFPSAPLTLPSSSCRAWGRREGGGAGCLGEGLGTSPAWPDCVHAAKWWLLGPFLRDSSVGQVPTVQRGPGQCHLHPLSICTMKTPPFPPAPIFLVQTFGAPGRLLKPDLSEDRTLVYGKDAFLISLSLPPSLLLSLVVILA